MSEDSPQERTRAAANVIVPGRLLQRGQIYTWTREAKLTALRRWGVTAVVNFWPKTDAELGELPLHFVWQASCPSSLMVLEKHNLLAGRLVASYLREMEGSCALVLCEAGKTRSVFFAALVVHHLMDVTRPEALATVMRVVPGAKLKPAHLRWLNGEEDRDDHRT